MGSCESQDKTFVSRAGLKLAHALKRFDVLCAGLVCADLGSQIGGFVNCLLQNGAARVYAVDTCYGTLAWKIRRDERVVVMERTNALHVQLPQLVDLVTIDVGWTRQAAILPHAKTLCKPDGRTASLPGHYCVHADGRDGKDGCGPPTRGPHLCLHIQP